MSQNKKLTAKQLRFASEYLVDSDPALAAVRAGYSSPAAGEKLLALPNVAAHIKKQADVTPERVVAELAAIGFSASSDFAKSGTPAVEGAKHKTTSKLKALELIGKTFGMFEAKGSALPEDLTPLAEMLRDE